MSLFGFDFFESNSINRFTASGGDGVLTEHGRGDTDSEGSLPSMPNSPEEALTLMPPAWIEVEVPDSERNDEESTEEDGDISSDDGGITILSSVPSSAALSQLIQAVGGSHSGVHSVITSHTSGVEDSVMSISTTQTHYTDPHRLPESFLSRLSLNPASVGSSVGDVSLLNRTPPVLSSPEDDRSLSSCADDSCRMEDVQLEPCDVATVPSSAALPRLLYAVSDSMVSTSSSAAQQVWYSQLQSEEDWIRFERETMDVLTALNHEDSAIDDRMLAMLIQEEEALFWRSEEDRERIQRQRTRQKGLVLMGNIAMLMAVPLITASSWRAMLSTRK